MRERLPTIPARVWWSHECKMWRSLWICLRNRRHMIVRFGRGRNYCWTCFHRYPYQGWVGLFPWLRNLLGCLSRWDHHWSSP